MRRSTTVLKRLGPHRRRSPPPPPCPASTLPSPLLCRRPPRPPTRTCCCSTSTCQTSWRNGGPSASSTWQAPTRWCAAAPGVGLARRVGQCSMPDGGSQRVCMLCSTPITRRRSSHALGCGDMPPRTPLAAPQAEQQKLMVAGAVADPVDGAVFIFRWVGGSAGGIGGVCQARNRVGQATNWCCAALASTLLCVACDRHIPSGGPLPLQEREQGGGRRVRCKRPVLPERVDPLVLCAAVHGGRGGQLVTGPPHL